MERFGAMKNGLRIAKRLRNMVGTRRLELLTSTVSIEVQQPVLDSKGVNNRRNRQNRNTRRNLLPNCYQKPGKCEVVRNVELARQGRTNGWRRYFQLHIST